MAWPFTKSLKLQEFLALNPSSPRVYDIASTWTASNAHLIAWSDHFNGYADIVTREVAVSVPAVSRAEKLLVGLADIPLVAERKDGTAMVPVDPQPTWTQRTDGALSPWHRMAATIRDIFYDGWSVWLVERGSAGQVLRGAHVPKSRIEIQGQTLRIDGRAVSVEEVIFFPGAGMGLLSEATTTIRGARAMDKAWIQRTGSPIPLVVLQETAEAKNLTDDEIEAIKKAWVDARGGLNGGVIGYVPYGMEIQTHNGIDDSALFIEGDNKVRLNIANYSNIPAALLDGSTATSSLTYVTQEGQRSSFHEQTVRYWLAPVEHRLSQDDVVPAGQRIRFDVTFLNNQPQETTSD